MTRILFLLLFLGLAPILGGCETWVAMRKDLHTTGQHIEKGIKNVNESVTNPDR